MPNAGCRTSARGGGLLLLPLLPAYCCLLSAGWPCRSCSCSNPGRHASMMCNCMSQFPEATQPSADQGWIKGSPCTTQTKAALQAGGLRNAGLPRFADQSAGVRGTARPRMRGASWALSSSGSSASSSSIASEGEDEETAVTLTDARLTLPDSSLPAPARKQQAMRRPSARRARGAAQGRAERRTEPSRARGREEGLAVGTSSTSRTRRRGRSS